MIDPEPPSSGMDPFRAEEVLDEALRTPAEFRDATLDRLCAGDSALRSEVASLMRHLPDPEHPDDVPTLSQETSLEGCVIGGCRIESLLGRGGAGRVFRARQEWPPRPVAVKVLRPELLSDGSRRRFRREAQALARLDHPAIARILMAGVQQDREKELPFLVMELVEDAQTLTAWWRSSREPVAKRLELFVRVCEAVHHGHIRGLVHRDLKPSNVLVGTDGQPKVIDFGVAAMTSDDGAEVTLTRAVSGTPGYMAPEQFDSETAVDLRIDVHGLGLLLHECLAGKPVYARAGLTLPAAARLLDSETPALLGTIDPECKGDLETIVAHALERDPARRYQSASEMAADLRRYLDGYPIAARATPPMDRIRLMVRRNPLASGGFAAAVLFLLVGVAATLLFALRERAAADTAARSLAQTERALWLSRLSDFSRSIESVDSGGARIAHLALGHDTRWPVRLLRSLADESVAICGKDPNDQNFAMMGGAVSPDGTTVAMVSDSPGGVRLSRADDLSVIRRLSPGVRAWAVTFDPVHGRLVVADMNTLYVWDAPWQDPPRRTSLPFAYGDGIAASPDGTRVALSTRGNCCVADLSTGEILARTKEVAGETTRVAWSPDGSMLAIGVEPESVRLLRASDLSEIRRIPAFTRRTLALDFDPTNRWLAFAGDARKLRVVDVQDPANVRDLELDYPVWGLRWHPDGRRIAICDRGSGVRLVGVPENGAPLHKLGDYRGHQSEVWWLEWNRAGDRLYSFGQAEAHAWRDRPRGITDFHELGSRGLALGRLPSGSVIALTADGSVWEVPTADGSRPRRIHEPNGRTAVAAATSPAGDRWAWLDATGDLTIFSSRDGRERSSSLGSFNEPIGLLSFSPSGRLLATTGRALQDPVVIVDAETGGEVARFQGVWQQRPTCLLWLDDDHLIAGDYASAQLRERLADGSWRIQRSFGSNWIGANLTPEGTVLNGTFSGEIVERSLDSDDRRRIFRGLNDTAHGSTVSDDGTLLAAVGNDRRLHVFDRASQEQLISIVGHPPGRLVSFVRFTPDGSQVVTLDVGGGLAIWDTRGIRNTPAALELMDQ